MTCAETNAQTTRLLGPGVHCLQAPPSSRLVRIFLTHIVRHANQHTTSHHATQTSLATSHTIDSWGPATFDFLLHHLASCK